jgi:two-component system cell cycle sensor histidine kinase/response regulator CckA
MSDPKETEGPLPRGSETILLVEDEAAFRLLAGHVLRELGYTVLEVRSGAAALETLAHYKVPVHLLLTDLMLPGMNGWEVWLAFAELYPEGKVVFMSGYDEIEILRRGILKPGTALLKKPFPPDALARKVREVLDLRRPKP